MEDRVVRRRAGTLLPLAATLVVLALSMLAASRITIDHDITRLLPDSDAELVQSAKALRSFLERTIVDVGSEDGSHSVELLGEVADRLVEDLEASGTVLRARADLALEDALEFVDFIRARTPLLLPESAWAELEAKLRPEAVIATLETLERRIQEPDGAYLAAQAPLDPLGFGNLALAPLVALAAGPPGAKLVDGRILNADEKHLLVLIDPGAPASDLARTTRFLEALEKSERRLSEVPAYRGVRLREMGAHRASKDNELQIRRDVKVTSLAASVLVALLIFLCFGRLRLALLSLSPALVGGVVGLGLFSLFRESVAAPALGFGAVLIGLTDDFAVHVLSTLTKGRERNEIPARAILLGALTTSLACALLCGSSLPGIRDIGLLGSIGILAAAFYALWVLPSLKPFLGAPKRPIVDLERLMQRSPVPRRAAWIALLATPLLALGAWRIGFDDEVRNLSSSSPEAAADEELLRATWGDSETSALVIEAPSVQAVLEANDELARWLDVAQRDGQILGHASITGLVPALETQEERWLRWRSFWTPERREELVASLSAATMRTRFRADAFAPFLRSLEAPPSWIEPAHFDQGGQERQGSSAEWVADRLVHDGENWRVLTPIFTDDRDQLARLAERLRVEQPEVVLANSEALMRRVAGLVSREMVILGMLSFLVIAVVVFGWLADWRLTLVVLLPLVLGLLWTLGILGWLGQELNLINSVFVVFQFGIAVDYSIFIAASYLERLRTGLERTAEARGAALLCALTTCAGFGALGLAGHPVLFTIGLTAFVAIACAAAASQIFVPVLCEALLGAQGREGLPAPRNDLATVNGPQWHRLLAGMYRYHGPFLKSYAASKAKRDPLVFALPGLCPGTGPVLIVGCGYGVMTARLASAYPEREIVALDPDGRKLDAAQSALANRFAVRFLREDVRSHASASIYEWVCLVDVLHYWDESAQREILACLRARMSADSRLLFRDGCAGPGTRNWIVRGAESLALLSGFTRPSGKLNFHSEEGWRRLLGECGFCVESAHPELGLFSNLVLICSRRANP